jgi:hypothetical protein
MSITEQLADLDESGLVEVASAALGYLREAPLGLVAVVREAYGLLVEGRHDQHDQHDRPERERQPNRPMPESVVTEPRPTGD